MLRPEPEEIAKLLALPGSPAGLPAACPVAAVRALADAVGDRALLAQALPPALLGRRTGFLDPVHSCRLYRVAAVWLMTARVFVDQGKSRSFLLHPHPLLGGEFPARQAASDEAGVEAVEQVLGRLYHGSVA